MGQEVVNLQDALSVLVVRSWFVIAEPDLRDRLLDALASERGQEMFGDGGTFQLVKLFQSRQQLPETGEVDAKTADALNRVLRELGVLKDPPQREFDFIVSGIVSTPGGAPAPNLNVTAFDRDLRTEQPVGNGSTTDANGKYRIVYSSNAWSAAEHGTADLVVRVFDTNGVKLGESAVRFNAGPNEVIDLVVPIGQPPEWSLLTSLVGPLLIGQDVLPDGFTDADIAFVVADAGVDREQLVGWAWAYKAALTQPLLPMPSSTTPTPSREMEAAVAPRREALRLSQDLLDSLGSSGNVAAAATSASIIDWVFYYACARNGLPRHIPDLLDRGTDELLSVAKRAVALNQVPARLLDFLEQLGASLDRARADARLKPAAQGDPASLGDILNSVSSDWLSVDQRRKLVDLVARVDVEAPDFQKQAQESGLSVKSAVVLQRSLRVAKIADGHLPAIAALQSQFTGGAEATLVGLTGLDATQWLDIAYRSGAPAGFAATPDLYGLHMREAVECAAPEAALRASIKNESVTLSGPGFASIDRFLANNSGFTFAHDDVDTYVARADLSGIDERVDDVAAALHQLQSLRRVGVRWEEAPQFVSAGITSIEQLAEYGSNGLNNVVGAQIDAQRTLEISQNAKLIKAAGIGLMSQTLPILRGTNTPVTQWVTLDETTKQIVDSSPSLRGLFGALEQCACDPCQSVLSPSAYLVDLLNFLARDNGLSWNMQNRRGDIYDMELSCDNAQIELPHIDLVNEVLENAVALPYEVSMGVIDVAAALRQHPYPAALVAALQDTTWEPVIEADLRAEVHSNPRMGTTTAVIADRYRRWTLEIRSGYFGVLGQATNEMFDLTEVDVSKFLSALDNGTPPSSDTLSYFNRVARGGAKLPADISELSVDVLQPGVRWRIATTVKGNVEIDDHGGTIRYSDSITDVSRAYSSEALKGTRRLLEAESFGGVLRAEARDASNYVIMLGDSPDVWNYSKQVIYDFIYVPSGIVIKSLAYQCTARDRDLSVRPQNRDPRAYRDFLGRADAVYPWTLPFDVDVAETRALMIAAGLDRATLMKAALPPDDEARRGLVAIEWLGMLRAELTLVTTAAADDDVWKRWGLKVNGGTATIHDSYDDTDKTGAPLSLLSTVSILLQQARLTFLELQWFLQSQFINPGLTATITVAPEAVAGGDCDPTRLALSGSSPQLLDRLHRFVRWQRRLKWSMPELDIALRVLPALPGYTANALADQLAAVEELHAKLGIPVETLLTAFYGFDRVSYQEQKGSSIYTVDPLYERLFQNSRTALAGNGAGSTRVPDPALAYDVLNNPASPLTVGDYAKVVAACVGLHAHDVLPLLNADYSLAAVPVVVDQSTRLSVEHLRILLRDAVLARALHVSPARLATMIDLQSQRPYDSPRALLQFCEDVALIMTSEFDTDQLRYILTHRGPQSFAWVFSEDAAIRALERLQKALRSADTQPAGTSASDSVTAEQLATLLDVNTTEAERLALLSDLTQLGVFELQRVVASLWPNFNDAFGTEARIRQLVEVAISWQRRAAIVTANLAQILGGNPALIAALLWFHLRAAGDAAAMELFADPKTNAPAQRFEDDSRVFDTETVAQAPEFRVLVKLHKFVLLDSNWRLTLTDLARFPGSRPSSTTLLGLELDTLPVVATSGRFVDWKRSVTLLQLSRATPGLGAVINNYTSAITAAGADPIAAGAAVWAEALDLPNDSVAGFAGSNLLLDFDANHAPLQACRDPLRMLDWYELMLLARRFALGADDVTQLIAESPGKPAIDIAVRALQARFGEPQWRDIMVKSANGIRAAQRDALVDYLVWRDGLRDGDELYERYLIDVQMAPCMNTTRLLQGIAAVQLFVQRCLMNLEEGIEPATVDPDRQWEWRKNYRVWEANRKIFLYPENWLHPELRDDKSELYRAFESALMQAEASDANAEKAVQGYLESLVDVAQISVMGMYEETPRPRSRRRSALAPSKILHVVGRSPDPPYAYYYRTNQQNGEVGSRWTPWERISLDLPEAHVVPFMLGGELHLVWPVVESQRDSTEDKDYYEVKLAWSRRTSLGWVQRKVATETATRIAKYVNRDVRSALALKLSEQGTTGTRKAQLELYIARKTPSLYDEATLRGNLATGTYESGPIRKGEEVGYKYSNWTFSARAFLKYLDTGRIVPVDGAQFFILGLRLATYDGKYSWGVYGGPNPDQIPLAGQPGYAADGTNYTLEVHNDSQTMLLRGVALIEGSTQVISTQTYSADPSGNGTGSLSANFLFTVPTDPDFRDPAVDPNAGVNMALQGRFIFEAGRDTRWVTDSNNTLLPLPAEAFAFESRWRERANSNSQLNAGLHPVGTAQTVFDKSAAAATYIALNATRAAQAGPETWYWEENASGSTSRFFRTLGAAQASALISVQPSGFEEAREYRYRYTAGREELFTPEAQEVPGNLRFGVDAASSYFPAGMPTGVDPRSVPLLQFHLGMPYGSYNWEVFYHLPMAAARFLASQQRYEEAQRWLACVFDPTSNDIESGRQRYWRCLPLRETNAPLSIQQLMQALADPTADPATAQLVRDQVAAWEADPFSPFAVARVRTSAYEWYTVMAYIENLIGWGDSLFRRDTRESLNEAAMLYVFAARILGRKPEVVPKQGFQSGPLSYRSLAGRMDEFSNAWVRLIDSPLGQLLLAWLLALQKIGGINPHAYDQLIEQLASTGALYFCIPQNDKLLKLWDAVTDRLWKIRHCQNIDGVERPLPLLDPPIDPELLIRAHLAGVDIADVLADLHSPSPKYRYGFLAQRALEFCTELKSLGSALLTAIEKKDGERLSLLRSTQDLGMLHRVEAVKIDQIAEEEANVQALGQSRLNAIARFRYLQRLLGNNDLSFDAQGVPVLSQHGTLQVRDASAPGDFRGLGLVQSEVDQVSQMDDAHLASTIAGSLKSSAAIGRSAAAALQSYPVTALAGQAANYVAQGLADAGDVSALLANDSDLGSRRSALIATFQRRREDWIQQSSVAVDEVRQIDKQIAAANLRKVLAEKDLANHRQSIENAQEIDDYIRERKFSNAELCAWMETNLLATYHGAYQLAFDLAKRAERAWRRELGESDSNWVQFGYWDGAKKGLQAGEGLHLDLNRMQVAYIERSAREYEITKHVSLVAIDPAALVNLRELGTCEISVPEALLDLDFPGHYFRRLKTVSLSIPCVTGPYGGVPATLRLLKSSIRSKSSTAEGYGRIEDDTRFIDTVEGVESVVTSSAQNDSGLFETNLRDERFLPFEGAGAISTWQLQLPDEFRGFDYDTISDVILHIRYTARDGGSDLKREAIQTLKTALNNITHKSQSQGLMRMFSLRHDFPTEWYRLTHPSDEAVDSSVSLTISKRHFPFLFSSTTVGLAITSLDMYSVPSAGSANPAFPQFVRVFPPGENEALEWSDTDITIGPLIGRSAEASVAVGSREGPATTWRFEVPRDEVATLVGGTSDLLILCKYNVS
jgi:hypothetical protein